MLIVLTISHKFIIINCMLGVNLDRQIKYRLASFRYFEENECHCTRFCEENVLLLVFSGILRFSENGKQIEVKAGEYYIQRKNCYQGGEIPSDSPKYLYVHFDGEWTDEESSLSYKGKFNYNDLSSLMQKLDNASHNENLYSYQQYLFLELLLSLNQKVERQSLAHVIASYIKTNYKNITSLDDICKKFNYSKNYIIRIFNKEFALSPIEYLNDIKIKRATYLLETTSLPITEIAESSGFNDYPYFYKRFYRKVGVSPQTWRKTVRENPLKRQ